MENFFSARHLRTVPAGPIGHKPIAPDPVIQLESFAAELAAFQKQNPADLAGRPHWLVQDAINAIEQCARLVTARQRESGIRSAVRDCIARVESAQREGA